MTDLNRVNFMSKERFTNLAVTNEDELYIVETTIPNDEDVVHIMGDETLYGLKVFNTTPTVGTLSQSDNSTSAASTAYVKTAISNADQSVVHLSGEETITSTKRFTGEVYVPSPAANSNDNHAATTAWVNTNFSTSASVVHTTGNESISGIKTFTECPIITRSYNSNIRDERIKNVWSNIKLANDEALPSQSIFAGNHSYDGNDFEYSTFFSKIDSNGTVYSNLWVHHPNGTAAEMGIMQTAAGATWTYAPTPPTNDDSTQIATTSWVNTKLSNTLDSRLEITYE